jgi:hypothetical protein
VDYLTEPGYLTKGNGPKDVVEEDDDINPLDNDFCKNMMAATIANMGDICGGPNARHHWARIRDRKRSQWRGRNRNNRLGKMILLGKRILPRRPRAKISDLPFGNKETINWAPRRRIRTKSPTTRHLRNTIMMLRRYPKVQLYLD